MAGERWMYQLVEVKPGFFGRPRESAQEKLNQLGQQGWELVAVVQPQGFAPLQMYFKKPM